MQRTLLKSKIHRATVTEADLHYEGSIAIDSLLLEAATILPFEQVQIYNLNNGERFTTYAIEAPAGSGEIKVNGAAARLACPGDELIVASYASFGEEEVVRRRPKIILVDGSNQPRALEKARGRSSQ
jgi:aspartate 1-decarboxylase